jgi:hypothetical protein
MKVAICVSGACRSKGNLAKNIKILKEKFPYADIFFATWTSHKRVFEETFPTEKCIYYDEPVMDYHPYIDIRPEDRVSPYAESYIKVGIDVGPEAIEWSSHHSKQILIHFWLADTIKDKYDVIIRTRFDVIFAKKTNFKWDLEDTFINQRANGFASYDKDINNISQHPRYFPEAWHNHWLVDMLIMHPAWMINVPLVEQLHREKKLHGGELGWFQVLSLPYGSNHRGHEGWVDRY